MLLAHHQVFATGTIGEILEKELGFEITKLQSGPLGGDQQVGARIASNEIELLRMAVVWNIPIACNRASADFMISSPLMDSAYER